MEEETFCVILVAETGHPKSEEATIKPNLTYYIRARTGGSGNGNAATSEGVNQMAEAK